MRHAYRHGGFAAVALLPLLLGGCLSGSTSERTLSAAGMPAGFGYRPVMRIDSSTPNPWGPAGGAHGRQVALSPDGRMKWVPAPKGWAAATRSWLTPPPRSDAGVARRYAAAPRPNVLPAVQSADGFVLPVSGAILTSTFGMREHPILGGDRLHAGIDLAAPTGTPVRAAVGGTLGAIGRNGGYGNYIRIDHGPISTAYAHLQGYAAGLTAGSVVQAGDIIGYVGSTGRSTGPHLHFEVLVGEDAIDPMAVIPAPLQLALGNAPRVELARGGR